jgi:tetrahydromethanopterin S-methyltransferase subunit G
VKDGFEHAQARLEELEKEAQKVVNDLMVRSRASRKDVEKFLEQFRFDPKQLIDSVNVKELGRRANQVTKQLENLRERAVAFAGVASQKQVDELARDIGRLSKKVDKALGLKSSRPNP